MNASRSIDARLLAALVSLPLTACAREEATRPSAARVELTPAANTAANVTAANVTAANVTAPSVTAASAASTLPTAAAASRFQTLVPGLAVLAEERTDAEGSVHEWLVTRLDLQQHRLRVRALAAVPFERLLGDSGLLVGVNGGFFDLELQASGLLLSGGSLLARERAGGGSGVLAVANGRAQLLQRGAALPAGTDFAVQCGPRLIEAGGAIGIRSDDGQRAARTAACVRAGGRELDLVVSVRKGQRGDGPGLLQLAQWLSEPLAGGEPTGCEAALNLDGGPSTGLVVAGRPEFSRVPLGPVPFALVVER